MSVECRVRSMVWYWHIMGIKSQIFDAAGFDLLF